MREIEDKWEPEHPPDHPLVLIVDDEADFRQFVADLLVRKGFSVLQAVNGQEAMVALGGQPASLLITEVVMEEMDGFELISKVRIQHPELPIIAMSGTGRVEAKTYLRIAKQLGAHLTLQKPFRVGDLLDAVCGTLRIPRTPEDGDSDVLL